MKIITSARGMTPRIPYGILAMLVSGNFFLIIYYLILKLIWDNKINKISQLILINLRLRLNYFNLSNNNSWHKFEIILLELGYTATNLEQPPHQHGYHRLSYLHPPHLNLLFVGCTGPQWSPWSGAYWAAYQDHQEAGPPSRQQKQDQGTYWGTQEAGPPGRQQKQDQGRAYWDAYQDHQEAGPPGRQQKQGRDLQARTPSWQQESPRLQD